MKEFLNVNMESSEITEEWIRKHFNVQKERKTTNKEVSFSIDLSDYYLRLDMRAFYDPFFDNFKNIIDSKIMYAIVEHNIKCNEKDIAIELSLDTDYGWDETRTLIYVYITHKHTETVKEAIARLKKSAKATLTGMKRKKTKQSKLAAELEKMNDEERRWILQQLTK